MQNFYETKTQDVLAALKTTEAGLSLEEAKLRLKQYGLNALPEKKPKSYLRLFISQFASPLIYILLSAAFIVFLMNEVADALIILFILIFNAFVGTFQEYKAQNTLSALKKFVETKATVLRDESEIIIPDLEVVPGDLVILQEGDKIPADLRIIKANNLRIDEAALTGESVPANKINDTITAKDLSIVDQRNMAFKSTHVVAGNGIGVVVATGVQTEIGKISREIASESDDSPLKYDIAFLSKIIMLAVALISMFLFVIGMLQNKPAKDMFTTVVALAVSVIPEGLPIVMTLVLASGVWRMTKKNALVKRLQAVESLGQAKIIAVDKTGTITKNEMVVKKIYTSGQLYDIEGDGYEPRGNIYLPGHKAANPSGKDLALFIKLGVLAANARIAFSEEGKNWLPIGDPTEAAIVCFGQKFGFEKDELENSNTRIQEIPFDYKTKRHIVVNRFEGKTVAVMAAAPEVLVGLSSKIYKNGKVTALPQKAKEEILKVYENFAAQGLRVIGLGYKDSPGVIDESEIKEFIFAGFTGIEDTIRPEAKAALEVAESAGLKVIMITGDNKITASAIAKEVGILKPGNKIITGHEIDQMSEAEFAESISDYSVFARVTPEHKLKIIKAYRYSGQIIAMTGDGVNDAPSLVAADLGVAMGKIGTEVAKEASDIVLLDDNFGNIVSAIEEGRNIYKTIKKVILYLFSTSFGEVFTIAGALILGYPLPVLASQIIWLNFVTDGFLDVSLAMEPKEEGLLNGNFTKQSKYLVDRLMIMRMLVMALPMMVGSLILFRANYQIDTVKAWTITLTVLAVFQWFNAWNCRHESKSIFQMKFFGNKVLFVSTLTVIFLQIFAVHNGFMQKYLHTTDLSLKEWAAAVAMASSIIIFEEIRKYFFRKNIKSKQVFSQA